MNFEETPRCKITLRCNYKCSYCPIKKSNRPEISGDEWIKILLEWPGDEVILEGGEPTIHKDFVQIVNEVGKEKTVRIYSNGSFPLEMLDKLKVKTSWYVSYHPGHKDSARDVAHKCFTLQEYGHRLINVHCNEGPPTATQDEIDDFQGSGIELKLERNYYKSDEYIKFKKEQVEHGGYCKYPRTYLDPQGVRYICVKKLEDGDKSGIVNNQVHPGKLYCTNLAQCNVCDVMVKGVVRGAL